MIFHGILSTKVPSLYHISCNVSTWDTLYTVQGETQISPCPCNILPPIGRNDKFHLLPNNFTHSLLQQVTNSISGISMGPTFLYKTVKSLSALIIVEVFHSVP